MVQASAGRAGAQHSGLLSRAEGWSKPYCIRVHPRRDSRPFAVYLLPPAPGAPRSLSILRPQHALAQAGGLGGDLDPLDLDDALDGGFEERFVRVS